MEELRTIAQKVKALHSNIAADVFPDGGTLTCHECGDSRKINVGDCAHYLRHGWPKCCSRTMRLEGAEVD